MTSQRSSDATRQKPSTAGTWSTAAQTLEHLGKAQAMHPWGAKILG
eukprot:CAMPEP_0172665888 /NCGR_PEP_ID=MMETSP1074-20121228/7502_1 /TAXON_ID=2916 /ORGANISM="Ceratium fusus, Strain PA161109" /LENGTH=45 /DNA_ID= /DNA_START= /DNA_END= /DNA_ORIENTATION=